MPDPIAHDLTFLFTDVEGSTLLLERLGPGYGIVLEKHRTLISAAITSNGGRVVDCIGDEFFAAFPDAQGAVAAAVDAQRRLGAEQWPQGTPVRVRIGVHSGRAHTAEPSARTDSEPPASTREPEGSIVQAPTLPPANPLR